MASSPPIRVVPLAAADVASTAGSWRRIGETSDDPHYALGAEWLGAWATTALHGPLALVEVGDLAVGLLEQRRSGRWAFAGGHATPQRRLLCAGGAEPAAWRALWRWQTAAARGCAELEGVGLPPGIPLPRWASITVQPSFAVALPDDFDAFLRERSPGTRKGLKSKLRRLEREGGAVVPVAPEHRRAVLDRFVALHNARAAAKGETHTAIDERLAALLDGLPEDGDVALRLFELRVGEDVAGVTVRLDHRGTGYFYNAGIDPERAALSPGVCLELASIRDAIARGIHIFDLGPGDYRYKHDLGGVAHERLRAVVSQRSAAGLALRAARAARARVRRP